MPLRLVISAICAGLAFVAAASPSSAETWPQRNVRFIVPLGPGSGADIAARPLADKPTARWGKPVVVENRPGGDGIGACTSTAPASRSRVSRVASLSGRRPAHRLIRARRLDRRTSGAEPGARRGRV